MLAVERRLQAPPPGSLLVWRGGGEEVAASGQKGALGFKPVGKSVRARGIACARDSRKMPALRG